MRKNPPVTILMAMKNSTTTVVKSLSNVVRQDYPIKEIIIIDNKSSDDSVGLVKEFAARSAVPIKIIQRRKNYGVGASFNFGVKRATTEFIILIHSDSYLPTKNEIKRLVKPFLKDNTVIATAPILLHPYDLWLKYSFWQKLLFARVVGTEVSSGNGKFDCIRKEIFEKVGGFDDINYGDNIGIGAEDSDLHIKLNQIGRVVLSSARVAHLHYLKDDFQFSDFVRSRLFMARSYGRLLRLRGLGADFKRAVFLVRPFLCIAFLLPIVGPVIALVYSLFYTEKMFTTPATLFDYRILFVPIVNLCLIYYETCVMLKSYLFFKK